MTAQYRVVDRLTEQVLLTTNCHPTKTEIRHVIKNMNLVNRPIWFQVQKNVAENVWVSIEARNE